MLVRITFLGAMILLACTNAALSAESDASPRIETKQPPGKTVDGLSLTLDRHAREGLEVTLENVGEKPLMLNLGMMSGKAMAAEQVRFIVTGADGKPRELRPKGLRVAGMAADLIVPLMPLAKYSFRVSSTELFDPSGKPVAIEGETIRAVFQGESPRLGSAGQLSIAIWKGTVESAPLRDVTGSEKAPESKSLIGS